MTYIWGKKMKLLTVNTSTAEIENGKIVWTKKPKYFVCASTKTVNNVLDDLRQKNEMINDFITKDFYFREEKVAEKLVEIVKSENVPANFVNEAITHLFIAIKRACCFIPDKKDGKM